MQIANLAMYVTPEPVAEATTKLWCFLRDFLRREGSRDVPDELDRQFGYNDAWMQPNLLLAQTCGFPYVKSLRNRVRLVATPCYSYPGCASPSMRSFIITRKAAAISSLEDLRGLTAAVNTPDSNSGMNLFRAAIAPIAGGSRFFGRVVQTGGHVESIAAVADGRADCAAIDCITYGHMQRFAPERLRNIVVIAQTAEGPGLPFITRGTASDQDVHVLRAALDAAILESSLAATRDILALEGFAHLIDSDYDVLLSFETEAERFGYPQIA
ncbi:phosphate ABC transporter substrate-binding protein [Neorhizobium lilium]|uniref:Phosphate ABC transporter substrate-binding protein n=1 Tax=Neorhizobium lilium TaxID=2503024 RepID=A0A3S3VSK1_9HYPH|nr:PhnD/SsuA/transferrin family substrate-binding protein [Neorhizobium lilium]RWX80959.1 phosphate ABC transporter substrate-binding protein [Neorhizobium lilium]